MISLKQVEGLVFDEYNHTYTTADGRELGGVTSLLSRQLFADKYEGIPKAVLERAADYGTEIHNTLEIYDTIGICDNPICEVYEDLIKGWGHVDSEYLVTDGEHVASKIDKVLTADGDTVILADIKTTSKLDEVYVSWQLSVYAYLFNLMNPSIKVQKLVAIWLPKPQYGKPAIVEVPMVDELEIEALLEADSLGMNFTPSKPLYPMAATQEQLPVGNEIVSVIANLLRAEKAAKSMKEKLREMMESAGVSKWECDEFTATIGKPSEAQTFDSKAFQADNEELYNKYIKTTVRKGGFTLKLK